MILYAYPACIRDPASIRSFMVYFCSILIIYSVSCLFYSVTSDVNKDLSHKDQDKDLWNKDPDKDLNHTDGISTVDSI